MKNHKPIQIFRFLTLILLLLWVVNVPSVQAYSDSGTTAVQVGSPIELVNSMYVVRSVAGSPLMGQSLLVIFGMLGVTAYFARRYVRYHRRECPGCEMEMLRLRRSVEDFYLDPVHLDEEYGKSFHYDAWKCPGCGDLAFFEYPKWFPPEKRCPGCHFQTLEFSAEILVYPSPANNGFKRVIEKCRHCEYKHYYTIVLLKGQRLDEDHSNNRNQKVRSLSQPELALVQGLVPT